VGQLDKAKVKAAEALALDENYIEARVLLGKVYIELGQYGQARAELARVCAQAPQSAEAVYLLGVAQEREGRLSDALESYRNAYEMDGTNVSAVLAAAEVLVALGQLGDAETLIESYVDLAPEDAGICEIAGRLAMLRKDYAKAVQQYTLACDQDPRNIFYQDALATAMFMAGKYKDSVELLKRMVELKDHKATAGQYGMLGNCYVVLNKPREARDAFAVQTQLTPNDPVPFVNLAKAALQLGDYPRSILSAQQAIDLDAGNFDATCVMGYALICDGQSARAVGLLTTAGESHPDNATLQCLLGRAHAASGDETKAIKCYKTALELEPTSVLARELLAASAPRKALVKIDPIE
jgi:tetratricopeptide (TPR) repeat protein